MTRHETDATEEGLIAHLGRRIDDALLPLIPPGSRCALIDFPNYANVGDSAIWLGENEWLRRHDVELMYACDIYTFDPGLLAAALGETGGIVLLSGGGNLGDFWIDHQRCRERVIEAFPDHRIVQLPQSVHFIDDADVTEAARVFAGHRDFTLLVRDQSSLAFARARLSSCRAALCPDMAFALGAIPRPAGPVTDILWLGRTDAEGAGHVLPPDAPDVVRTDWADEAEEPATDFARRAAALWNVQFGPLSPPDRRQAALELMTLYPALAAWRVDRGCRLLSQARVVVTDRLHGHILCLLLGLPHVVLDNVYGKLRAFHDAFTRGSGLTHTAESAAQALSKARSLARSLASRAQPQ